MSICATELESKDYGRYEELNRRSPHGSVWSAHSWTDYVCAESRVFGVHRGGELIGGANLPVAGERLLRYLPGTPWYGPVARSTEEGECLEIARALARYLLARYDEVTLTLPPEWADVRAFTWEGMRPHVRYTYRGAGVHFEKRVQSESVETMRQTEAQTGGWRLDSIRSADGSIKVVEDWNRVNYWDADPGGEHTPLVCRMIEDAAAAGLGFDMVGCNSPKRALFKRAFGGTLTPYYAVTTCDAPDLRA